jgi:polynucleotide 5'-hydroxyl-kinase GRC3/NOL9
MDNVQVLPGWKELTDSISRLRGVVVILGATDTGKTTLASYLCQELSKGCKVAMISADIGQCAFGPPATLSMALLDKALASTSSEVLPFRGMKASCMYFIGSTSPVGHLLQVTVGLKKLVEKAQGGGAKIVVIDTSGFVEGGAAWELKFHKIELTNARHIVALQRRQELEGILSTHEGRTCRTLHRLKIHEGIRPRSYEQRRGYRRQRFLEYFSGVTSKGIPLGSVRLINPMNVVIGESSGSAYKRLLVGLNDDENFTLGLGVIEDIDPEELLLLTPVEGLKEVKIIRLGAIRLDEDWYDSQIKFTLANRTRGGC